MSGNPLVCVECFYPHGQHAASCKRRRMTGEQFYQLLQTALLGVEDPKPSAVLYEFSEIVRRRLPDLWPGFESAMLRHGYNPHNVDATHWMPMPEPPGDDEQPNKEISK